MTALPTVAYISNATRKSGEQKVALEQVRDFVNEMPGGGAESTLTIASGVASPLVQTGRFFSINGQGSASDDLTHFDITNIPDGGLIFFRCANGAVVITVKHAAGGDGQFNTVDGLDLVLDDVKKVVVAKRTGALIEIFGMLNFQSGAAIDRLVVASAAGQTLVASQSGTLWTNEGASGDTVMTLPPAVLGLWYEFSTVAAHKLKVLTVSGDVIGDIGGTDSADPGYIQSSAAKGNTLRLVAVNGARWAVQSKGGTWTIDS